MQLVGIVRPIILLIGIGMRNIDLTLAALAAFSVLLIILRKQRYPVWTMKAKILVVASILITCTAGFFVFRISYFALVILPLLQPFALFAAWMLFLPIDRFVKEQIMKKAKNLRSQFTNATVIGITGSVGKTTTKELIAHVLKDRNVLYTPAYV
ncbi:MAG: Mur ligase family protein, partial [Candidatus Peribacteraceae bacterium]|nr:Mur ligase family protein [Candidatus Peribacteraceae bacterium]